MVCEPEFSIKVRIYYEDTDFGGVVFYANYLKYMERARTEFLRCKGVNQSELFAQERRLFVVKSAQLDYLSAARFDDLLSVTAEVATVRRASMQFVQHCTQAQPADGAQIGKPVVSARVTIACLDADSFKPCAIPGALKMSLSH
ncbi:tol-pal system-associated acyl-CoA thioesterase [Chromatiales bacterium (ex Bugula neritina AB1)]|nr:tol-pal system-associated acyl-CoA thioesterase [Chromatiales bacterium (ex Bugula neritina AB1)]